jgi:diguanylate cyclase (GGDEF)-like protein
MTREAGMSNRMVRCWRQLGITSKLWFAFSLLFVFFAMGTTAGYVGLVVVREAETDILANMEIRHNVLEMEGQLEKARRLYRDFIIYAPEVGFEKAQELYSQPAQAVAARVIAISEELKRSLGATRRTGAIARRNVDINLFSATARRFSQTLLSENALVTTLADPQSGLEARLAATVDELGRLVAGSTNAVLLLREADVLEKQYRITRQRPYMQSALNKVEALRRFLPEALELSPPQRQEAEKCIREYVLITGGILDTVVALTANSNDFALQARAVDPISEELKTMSAGEVERARGRIKWASIIAGGIILTSALLGLGCIVAVGKVLHASITSKIVALTRHASAVRAGHLDVVASNGGTDELGVLAETFNAMTHRIRDLVENLEENVRQRTRELARTNRELDRKNQALAVLSLTDRLTGLCNRRKIDQAVLAEWRRAKRYGTPFSVVMIDLDNFKDVNDRFGHGKGDEVLVRVADILVAMTRETDTVGRWGGEEFLLICPQTGIRAAMSLAENIRQEIAATEFPTIGGLTASFGLAAYNGDADPRRVVDRADTALYRAKAKGRNRIEGGDPDAVAGAA